MLSVAKVKRELMRLGRQAASAPSSFFDAFLSRRFYDVFLYRRVRVIFGKIPLSSKVAIFLIYPKNGLTRGHVESLRYMLSEGYSPIIVSNFPLREDQMEVLLDLAHAVIVRPNYGYDFAGYRDGIRFISFSRENIAFLALFNDSCWFPLPKSDSWLLAAEGMQVDFAGCLSHANPEWNQVVQSGRGSEREIRKYTTLFHYCSFALLFSHTALRREDFWCFWNKLRISSSKDRTVKHGERALSKFMFDHGFSHAVTLNDIEISDGLRSTPRTDLSTELLDFDAKGGWQAYALREHLWIKHRFMFLKKSQFGAPLRANNKELSDYSSRVSEIISDVLVDKRF